jgi:hypothetical protein
MLSIMLLLVNKFFVVMHFCLFSTALMLSLNELLKDVLKLVTFRRIREEEMNMDHWSNDNAYTRIKTCPSAGVSTTTLI